MTKFQERVRLNAFLVASLNKAGVSAKITAATKTTADCNGTEWQFSGCQDFEEGDLIALIMNDNGTQNYIWDDTVVTARYSGGTKLFDQVYAEKGD